MLGGATLRESVVLRQGAGTSPQGRQEEDARRQLETNVLGPLPGRERIRLQVNNLH
jgi:hypothetical protein